MSALRDGITLTGLARLGEALAGDEGFRDAAAAFDGRLAFGMGATSGWLDVAGGEVRAVGLGPADAAIGISGDVGAWDDVLGPVPGGLHRAWRHRILTFSGDGAVLMRHYTMIWQLGRVLPSFWRGADAVR